MRSKIQNPATATSIVVPDQETYWWTWAARGLAALATGTLALIYFRQFLFIWYIASFIIFAGVNGLFALIESFRQRHSTKRWWALFLEGLVSLLFSLMLSLGAMSLMPFLRDYVWHMVALWAIATGIFQIIKTFNITDQIKGERWLLVCGCLALIFGALWFVFWSVSSEKVILQLLTGLLISYYIGFGIVMLFIAFSVRRFVESTPATSSKS